MPPQHMMGKKSLSRLLLYKKKTAGSTRPLDGYFCNRYGYSGFSTECSSLFSQHLTTGNLVQARPQCYIRMLEAASEETSLH
uniref:Uncharacterized protein n=1 Tax=Aegilops tauschii subsp. strangulata TaxID=200361 RepID=A0A453R9Y1_AEGTS